jgi:hypothetical protein
MADPELDRFINQILDEKQLSGVTPEVRVQLVADLKERLLDQINRALITALPEEKIVEFNLLLDDETASDEAIRQFITNSGVDVQKVTLQTMLRFSELYLGRQGLSGKVA